MVTLPLFTKKHKLYYIGLIITVITLSFITVARICDLKGESRFEVIFDIILFLSALISAAFFSIVATGLLPTYLKDGELILTDNYLVIDNLKILLNDVQHIDLDVATRINKSLVLEKNSITIVDKAGNEYKRRFAIKSYNQNQDFELVLKNWREQGVSYSIR